MKIEPYQFRQPGETMAAWANRLRRERGNDHLEWFEDDAGQLRLREVRNPQSKLDLW